MRRLMRTKKDFLIIVEGAKTEKDILEAVFQKYNFEVHRCGQMQLSNSDLYNNDKCFFERDLLESQNDRVFIIQGERNRLSDWLKCMNKSTFDYSTAFREYVDGFAGVFVLYDLDHNSNDVIEQMTEKFNSETDIGLLLLSSPCIEVMSDYEHREIRVEHLSEYKSNCNVQTQKEHFMSAKDYIIDNFEQIAVRYLDQNTNDFNEKNVMEHPKLVASKINQTNIRALDENGVQYVICRYFTTVIYVCVAYIMGLTKEIDNAEKVKEFLLHNL